MWFGFDKMKRKRYSIKELSKAFSTMIFRQSQHITKHYCLQILTSMNRLDHIISLIRKYFFNAQYVFGTLLGHGN